MFSSILDKNGSIFTFGRNVDGELGQNDYVQKSTPTIISILSSVIEISAGYEHSMILNYNGDAYSFGSNLVNFNYKIDWTTWA
jgi:alpha-tubulin suppressor-like RCC1 family protein